MKRGTSARNGLAARCHTTGRPRFGQAMSSEAHGDRIPTDENAPILPSSASLLGVDGEGDEHYYSAYHARLWVDQAEGDVITMGLAPEHLTQWVDRIDARYGWAECHHSRADPFAALAERAAGGI